MKKSFKNQEKPHLRFQINALKNYSKINRLYFWYFYFGIAINLTLLIVSFFYSIHNQLNFISFFLTGICCGFFILSILLRRI